MIGNLKEMGMSNKDIAKELGVSRNIVGRRLKEIRKSLYNGGYRYVKSQVSPSPTC